MHLPNPSCFIFTGPKPSVAPNASLILRLAPNPIHLFAFTMMPLQTSADTTDSSRICYLPLYSACSFLSSLYPLCQLPSWEATILAVVC